MKTDKKYLMDTNTLIEFNWGTPSVVDQILKVGIDVCCISVISLCELYYGAYYAKTKKNEYFEREMMFIEKLMQRFSVLSLPVKADCYGKLKNDLRQRGELVDEFDMIIAGQALEDELILVTDNVKHFNRIPDLKVENWLSR